MLVVECDVTCTRQRGCHGDRHSPNDWFCAPGSHIDFVPSFCCNYDLWLQRGVARARPREIVRGGAGSARDPGPATETDEDPARARLTDAGPGEFIH